MSDDQIPVLKELLARLHQTLCPSSPDTSSEVEVPSKRSFEPSADELLSDAHSLVSQLAVRISQRRVAELVRKEEELISRRKRLQEVKKRRREVKLCERLQAGLRLEAIREDAKMKKKEEVTAARERRAAKAETHCLFPAPFDFSALDKMH